MSIDLASYSRRENDPFYRFLKMSAQIYSRIWHRTRVERHGVMPAAGPAILVCNHTSSIDPVLLQAFCPRLVRWMMAREYFEFKLMRWFFNTMGVILVDRSGHDLSATRTALRTLKAGYVLGVFPEGKISASRELLPFQSGIGLIALKTRAPVYPAFLDGSQRESGMLEAFFRPGWARITYGRPVELADLTDSKADVLEATRRIQAAVEAMQGSVPRLVA